MRIIEPRTTGFGIYYITNVGSGRTWKYKLKALIPYVLIKARE
jgi:hypothetical protein